MSFDIKAWNDAVSQLVSGTATREAAVAALTGWLNTEVAAHTEGRWEPVARRMVWVFPTGCMLTVGFGFNPTFAHLTEKITPEHNLPMSDFFKREQWVYSEPVNGWVFIGNKPEKAVGTKWTLNFTANVPDAATVINMVEAFTGTHGTPQCFLPWRETWLDIILEQGEEYYEYYEPDENSVESYVNVYKTMFQLVEWLNMKAGKKDTVKINEDFWETFLTDEVDKMSEHSDWEKFHNFVNSLETHNAAIIDLDQHCAGCSSGVAEWAVEQNPKLEGKPVFRTWGQNSEDSWLGDGKIFFESHIDDTAGEKRVKFLAEEAGLHTGVYEDDWEPTGYFEYESSDVEQG